MEVSGEVADLVVKEGLQATESAVKLAANGLKNVAALLLALARQDYKVVGKTNSKRLARDPAPPSVTPLKTKDMEKFQKLAKQYGVLYFIAKKEGVDSETIDVVSTQNYAAKLNAIYQALGYPAPGGEEKGAKESKEDGEPKKAKARAPRENSSKERGSGSIPSPERTDIEGEEQKPSVKKRLAALKAASEATRSAPERTHEKTR